MISFLYNSRKHKLIHTDSSSVVAWGQRAEQSEKQRLQRDERFLRVMDMLTV